MSDLEERLAKLEQKFTDLCGKEDKKPKKEKKDKVPRKPSKYNEYMAAEIKKIKKEKGEDYNHKEAFAKVAELWQEKKKEDDLKKELKKK